MPLPLAPHQTVHCGEISLRLKIHCFNWVNLKQSLKEKKNIYIYISPCLKRPRRCPQSLKFYFCTDRKRLQTPVAISCNGANGRHYNRFTCLNSPQPCLNRVKYFQCSRSTLCVLNNLLCIRLFFEAEAEDGVAEGRLTEETNLPKCFVYDLQSRRAAFHLFILSRTVEKANLNFPAGAKVAS